MFLVYLFPFSELFCLYGHNSDNYVIGIPSMKLNEGNMQISLQMLAKKSLGCSYFGAWAVLH